MTQIFISEHTWFLQGIEVLCDELTLHFEENYCLVWRLSYIVEGDKEEHSKSSNTIKFSSRDYFYFEYIDFLDS